MPFPTTLLEAVQYFSTFENCKAFMVAIRWSDSVVKCPTCGSSKVTWLENARLWKCYSKHARPKFSLKTGTIFEDSPLGLDKWLPVIWLLVNSKNGISSWEVHRAIGVTQKTAWFMLQRGRLALQDLSSNKIGGEVEVDETYIGGKARNMHKSRKLKTLGGKGGGAVGKTAIQGLLMRHGKVHARVVGEAKRGILVENVKEIVDKGSNVFTDDAVAYYGMLDEYDHQVINHAEAYVKGNVHTNGIENFWSLLKRGLNGTYVSVEPYHLFRYVDEQAFRFNNRDMTDELRFRYAMRHIVGRRLTYRELTGKLEEGPTVEELF
jgi:transposase-like protein